MLDTYTPIAIRYLPAGLTADGLPLTNPKYGTKLEIVPPIATSRGLTQASRRPLWITVPQSGLVKLKLLPSPPVKVLGEYVVNFYYGGLKVSTESQRWFVPSKLDLQCDERTWLGQPLTLDIELFEIISVSRDGWEFNENKFNFITDPPPIGTKFSFTYQPAVTLDRLVVKE